MTLQHYIKQPRSILCRKLERNFIEKNDPPIDDRDFVYNSLPYCFRDIGFQPCPLLKIFIPWMIYFSYI